MEKIEKAFGDCTVDFLENSFGLRQIAKHESLDNWLDRAIGQELSQAETLILPIFQQLLTTNVASWNEQDLSLHFIGPIFSLINFTEPYRFNLFAERRIESEVTTVEGQNITLFGKPDEMIASGFRVPQSPYFCFQEFKREKDPNGDPTAQALAAMLVGLTMNKNTKPMYGCYVLGRDWYFMTLKDNHFCISRGYDATTEHLYELYKILKALKDIVRELAD